MKFTAIVAIALVGAASAQEEAQADISREYTSNWDFTSDKKNVTTKFYHDPETKTMIEEMRQKWDDYFFYSFQAKNVTEEAAAILTNECSTSQECSDSAETTQCCVNTVLNHPATGTKDIMYRCMTKSVVNANINMELGDFQVNMKCMGSAASALAVGASLVSVVAASLY